MKIECVKIRLVSFFAVLIPVLLSANAFSQVHSSYNIISPNGKIKVILSVNNRVKSDTAASASFKVYYKNNAATAQIFSPSVLGLNTAGQAFKNIKLLSTSKVKAVHVNYRMIAGKRKICTNEGNEQVFSFSNTKGKKLNVIFRVYNDGLAFRYQLPPDADKTTNVTDEYTTYQVPANTSRWVQHYDPSYEDYYPYSTTGKEERGPQWGYPALFKANHQPVYYLISEAGNSEENCASRLNNAVNPDIYKVTYPEPRGDFKQQGIVSSLPWESQWHTVIIGSLATVVQSTLITDVSKPSQIADTKWIVPGAASWIYWANNHGSKDYKKVVEYVDLASNMGWPYVLIDWEWDTMSNGGNVEDAVRYAKSKGIKPLLWYNSGTTDWADATPIDRLKTREKREKEFQWLNKIGVYGVKVDFFAGDQQDMMKLYLDMLKDAAKYHLMVDFHGATMPRGWSRTYPNLITVEAVYGAEWYNNKDVLTKKAAVHNTTLPFTRNVIGPMDYTPVTFSNSQHPHTTSYGHELALSVVFESALQNFADRPEVYEKLPDEPKNFLKTVPTAWDETRLLSGYTGGHVVIARRKGSKWYIGGLSGSEDAKSLTFDLNFIQQKKIKVHVIRDGQNDHSFTPEVKVLTQNKKLSVDCLPRGGFVATVDLNDK